jgi:hypothetical protein
VTKLPHDKYWAVSGAKVYDEDGVLLATFESPALAAWVVERQNIEVELEEPDPPEVVEKRKQNEAERLAAWKQQDPDGSQLLNLAVDGLLRVKRLLTYRAPTIIVNDALKLAQRRVGDLLSYYPYEEQEEATHD